jgi:hypothetical protein
MSGILNKKQRILDFIITNNGRSQIEDGDIRYKFATFSDQSILYTEDHEASKVNKSNISNSEFNYLPLEATSKVSDMINPEFDLGKFFSYTNSNILNSQEVKNSINFNASVDTLLSTQSLSAKLSAMKLITTKNRINDNAPIAFVDNGFLPETINFQNNTNLYKTISSYEVNKENLPVIALDKRFTHKRNFKVMIPKDISGNDLYDASMFQNIDKLDEFNTTGYVYNSYNTSRKSQTNNINSREKEILEVVKSIESDEALYKRVYELTNNSDENTFIFELHEARLRTNDLEKLSFIKLGDFYDKETATTKKVYLIGKIINTRDDSSDLETLFNFNDGEVNLTNNTAFLLSAFYSFVTLFTLVIE